MRSGLLEIARKNFKTFNSGVIFILLMLTEPDFSRFFSVAPDLALSSELKNAIRKIIKVSPALFDEEEPAFKLLRSQIICLLNDNEYTPLAYSNDGMDGKLANAFLADEAGALDDMIYPWDTATGLLWYSTLSSSFQASPCRSSSSGSYSSANVLLSSIRPSRIFFAMSISSIITLLSLGYWVLMMIPSLLNSVIWEERMASTG